MPEFEKMLRMVAEKNIGSAIEILLNLYGDGQTYFHGKTPDGLTVFVHHAKKDVAMDELLCKAEEVLQDATKLYEEEKE